MKSFTVVFIPAHAYDEDDPSDYKEWKTVNANNKDEAIRNFKGGQIIRCTED